MRYSQSIYGTCKKTSCFHGIFSVDRVLLEKCAQECYC